MESTQTCGKGLAEHSALPAKMAELIGSLAENLEIHMTVLDLSDENSRREHDVYSELAAGHRKIAVALQAIAGKMVGYRDLPMGRHDPKAMSGPRIVQTFERFVRLEQELLELVENRVQRHRALLGEMKGAIE